MELKITHNKGVTIQDDLIGIFFEDINYGADGGLYAEMLENRSFEFLDARGDKERITRFLMDYMDGQRIPRNKQNCRFRRLTIK